jgi:hypothetical protein
MISVRIARTRALRESYEFQCTSYCEKEVFMNVEFWEVDGVHTGKNLSDLPITYLLWFVGSPIMRRRRWVHCQRALCEIRRRLKNGTHDVEFDLISHLNHRVKSRASDSCKKIRR